MLMRSPALSVVVPSVSGVRDLTDCLHALFTNAASTPIEVLVPDRCGEPLRSEVARRFPRARVLPAAPGTSIPDLRAIAFAEARAGSIAVIEDHVLVPPGWAEQMLEAQARGEDVVAGAVCNAATDRLVDWAAFFCDYGHVMPPLPAGPAEWLTGNNTVYRRDLLRRYRAFTGADRWEGCLHDALRRDGVRLVCRPDIQVRHKKHYTVGEFLSQRYLYARSYAGSRLKHSSPVTKAAYGIAALALPPLLFARIVGRVLTKRGHRWRLVCASPLVALFVCAWAAGEVVGAWAGAGDSLSRVC